MSNFPFVSDPVLRSNLDLAFDHIVDLLTLSLSTQYEGKTILVSSLRKTIIIHTACIIEALLLWKLKNVCKTNKIQLTNEWKYYEINTIHTVDESTEIIAGFRKKEEKDVDKLDFVRITDYCYEHSIINSKELKNEIDAVRKLRNRLHLGGLSKMEKEYSESDLEFCFLTAKNVKEIVSK